MCCIYLVPSIISCILYVCEFSDDSFCTTLASLPAVTVDLWKTESNTSCVGNPWFVILHSRTRIREIRWVFLLCRRHVCVFFCDLCQQSGLPARFLMNCNIADENRHFWYFSCKSFLLSTQSLLDSAEQFHCSKASSIFFHGKHCAIWTRAFFYGDTVLFSSAALNYPFAMWTECHAICIVYVTALSCRFANGSINETRVKKVHTNIFVLFSVSLVCH